MFTQNNQLNARIRQKSKRIDQKHDIDSNIDQEKTDSDQVVII